MKKLLCLFFLLTVCLSVNSQDSLYARKVIDELTAKKYSGRGYVKNGDFLAANYIAKQYKDFLLSPILENETTEAYFQKFNFNVNTFPGAMKIKINGKKLIAGVDYIVGPNCKSVQGNFEIYTINKTTFLASKNDYSGKFILIDTVGFSPDISKSEIENFLKNNTSAAGFIFIEEKKLTWSVANLQGQPSIRILRNSLKLNASINFISIDVESKLIDHQTQNVIGKIKGTSQSDSTLVITAHYDHLGMMGKKTYFPGANDNASGISMLLNLVKYYSKKENTPKYNLVFICFAGEEAGLVGSEYYTEHPIYPLEKIKFLLNLDLLGTGDEGMMVVNGSVFEKEWQLLDSINSSLNLLPKIGKRGKAHNSDHYYFTEKGVPSFFCYTLGGRTAYHDIYDIAKGLPLTKYKESFILLRNFLDTF